MPNASGLFDHENVSIQFRLCRGVEPVFGLVKPENFAAGQYFHEAGNKRLFESEFFEIDPQLAFQHVQCLGIVEIAVIG